MTPLLADLACWWLQAGILLGAGLVLPSLVRLRDPGARLRLGQILIAAAVFLPLFQPGPPPAGEGTGIYVTAFSRSVVVAGDGGPGPVSVETAVVALLAAGAVLRLGWLGVGLLRLRALRRRSRPLDPLPPAIASAAARTGAAAEVLVSREVASPVTFGWVRPAILLPEGFEALDVAEQEAVACHELLHVRRRDGWDVLLEEGARALLWAQPTAWAVLSGISLSREQVVDRAVVEATGDRRAYLRALACIARLSQESPGAALPFHTRSHLVRRVAHLAKEVPMSRARLSLATSAAAAVLLLVGAAGATALPFGGPEPSAPPDKAAPPAAKADPADGAVLKVGGDVKEPLLVSRVQPSYPEESRQNKVQGRVILEAVIDEKGNVAKVQAIESPDPLLTEAAVQAVKKWIYKPATLKGKPVRVLMTVTVSFKLA